MKRKKGGRKGGISTRINVKDITVSRERERGKRNCALIQGVKIYKTLVYIGHLQKYMALP
jgi:hypothetical protein